MRPSPISISACTGSNCQFSINGGGFTSTATTVANGNTVQVRQTSSGSYDTTTALTLDVGGVTGTFNVTTESAPDTMPDAFSFGAQDDIALSTATTSNSVTISGIDAPANIGIDSCTGSNCGFSINGGGFTAAPTTVANGDSVQVRQTSSASYATTTTLTLNIGGVTDAFDVTTEDAPEPVVEGPTPTGTGTASAFVEPSGNVSPTCDVSQAAFLNAPEPPPEGVTLPHGLFGFTASGCTAGFSVDVTVNYPDPIPPDASYWKYDAGQGWYTIPANIEGNTVTFTITDEGLGDANEAAGTITDPGGIALGSPVDPGSSRPVPTLSVWQLMLLTAGLAILAAFGLRKQLQ